MQRVGATPLRALAPKSWQQAQVLQQSRQRELPFQVGEIQKAALADWHGFS
jgi:hypothetical protein